VKLVVLKDFSVLEPESVVLKIGNREDILEIDLSVFPAFLSLKIGEILDNHDLDLKKISMDDAIQFMASNLGKINPRISEEFLREKCSEQQVAGAFMYLLQRHLEERSTLPKKKNPKNQ